MNTSPHEELARRLLEEPSSAWPDELQALRVPIRPMPASLRSQLNALATPAPLRETPRAPARLPTRGTLRLAAAATLVLSMGVALYLYSLRSPTGGRDSLVATVTVAEGSLRRAGAAVVSGDTISEGDELAVAAGSRATVSAARDGTEAQLQIQPDSQMRFDALRREHVQAHLHQGSVLASLAHKDQNKDAGTSRAFGLSLTTSTCEARVTGTSFSWEQSPVGDTTLATFEGTVAFRRRWDALEDLPEELIAESEVLSATRRILVEAESPVPAGSQSAVAHSDFRSRLQGVAALERLLAHPALTRLRTTRRQGDRRDAGDAIGDTARDADLQAEIETARRAIDEAFPTPQQRAEIVEHARKAFGQPPVVRTMDRAAFRREAVRLYGKAPQEIVLKTGETIFGTVFGEDGRYRVYTATGLTILSPDQIEEIRFE